MNKRFQLLTLLCAALFRSEAVSAQVTNSLKAEPSSALPVLIFQTGGQPVLDRTRAPGLLTLLKPSRERADAFTIEDCTGRAELSVRGNSSYHFSKKSYRLELQGEDGRDRKTALLGMPADSDWILYAAATDRTFARNVLAQELWRRLGRYTVRWRFVEVFVITNHEPVSAAAPEKIAQEVLRVVDALSVTNPTAAALILSDAQNPLAATLAKSYMGLYVVMEKIKRAKDRVNIKRLRPEHDAQPEISGGYIIKKDDLGRNERGLLTGQELKLRFEEPKESELAPKQREWITRYLDDFEKALFGPKFRDPLNGYSKYLDTDSFIDFHWLVEIAKNADGYWLSQYMHKDRAGKLTMGPLWDWDNAFSNPFFRNIWQTNGWRFEMAADPDYTWFRRLFEDPDFLQRYVDRWAELRTNILTTSNMHKLVDGIAQQVREAQARDELRWPAAGTSLLPMNSNDRYTEEVKWLKGWIAGRLAWIDSQEFPKPVTQIVQTSNSDVPNLAMAWLVGRLFYTTNNTDPRLLGGLPSPGAFEYSGPIPLAGKITVTARVRSNFGLWSAPVAISGNSSRNK